MGWTPLFLKAEPHSTGTDVAAEGDRPQGPAQVLGGDLLLAEVLLHDRVVVVRDHVDQLVLGLLGDGLQLDRDLLLGPLLAHAVVPDQGPHPDQVDHAPEVALGADRELDDRRRRVEAVADHVRPHCSKSAPIRSILLTKQIRGTPYLSAWRQTVSVWGSTPATASKTATAPSRTRSDRSTSTVKSTWPGVSMMLIERVAPVAGGGGRGDGDAALLLLDHPVHGGGALVDLADLVVLAGVVEDPLGRGGLARVDVGHDPDVAGLGQGMLADGGISHDAQFNSRIICVGGLALV